VNIYLVIPYADTADDQGYCGAVRAIRADSEQRAFDIMANSGERGGCDHGIHELVELPKPVRLTASERAVLAVAAVGASHEVSVLIGIVERLTGEAVVPADEK
jgi:hypothetical protein